MAHGHTTAAVQRCLSAMEGNPNPDAVAGELIARAAGRLEFLCRTLLVRRYPRLTRPPLNLEVDEMLGAVVARLIRALRSIRPETPRQFFGLATKHMRWELNDLARTLDERSEARGGVDDDWTAAPETDHEPLSVNALRMLEAIDALPDDAREIFELVRVQGLTHAEVAELLGVSTKTVQRRLQRSLLLLADALHDLRPAARSAREPQ